MVNAGVSLFLAKEKGFVMQVEDVVSYQED